MHKRLALNLLILSLFTATAAGQRIGPIEIFQGGGSYLGVTIRDVVAEDVERLELERETGVVISSVSPDSPAEKAGLQEEDVILSISGIPIVSSRQFQRILSDIPAGREVDLGLSRNGSNLTLQAELSDRTQSYRHFYDGFDRDFLENLVPRLRFGDRSWDGDVVVDDRRPRLGIQGLGITQQLADFFGVPKGKGVLIMEVLSDSPAQAAKLRAGDVIVRVDDYQIEDLADLKLHLDTGEHTLEIVREKRVQEIEVEITESSRRSRRSSTRM